MPDHHDSDLERPLREMLWVLREYLPELVLIGGWVPELWRRYGGFAGWSSRSSYTTELDVLVEAGIPSEGRASISDALRAAGFRPLDGARVAAVWMRDETGGEKVEFLIGLATPAMRRARAIPIDSQPGLGALPLPEHLNLLRHYTATLRVPVGRIDGEARVRDVRVPTLGAYVLNKAAASQDRPAGATAGGASDKRWKDLLYIRDIAAAGDAVMSQVEVDVADIAAGDAAARAFLRTARTCLANAIERDLTPVADMLAARDQISPGSALADLQGYLSDIHDVLDRFGADRTKRRRPR